MAGATSLKEPSMEEVLASIRRIIESGDDRRRSRGLAPAPEAAEPTPEPDLPPPASAPALHEPPPTPELPRFDVHYLPAALGPAEPEAEALPEQQIFAVDSGGRPGAAIGRAPEFVAGVGAPAMPAAPRLPEAVPAVDVAPPPVAAPAPAAHPDAKLAASVVAGNENAVARGGGLRSSPDFSTEFDDSAFEAALWADASDAVAEPESEPVTIASGRPVRQMPESVIDGASALLSAQAGDQVASAFDELARAIRSGPMRSMEEMARELMRPMLQEWLDDNLPRLVERLVRDEIERIARGPRR